jgi:nucleoside-diphosphate-sugar epimerase
MKALVTGASGFIGRVLVDSLLAHGHQVRALVRRSSVVNALIRPGVELIYGDVRDQGSVKQAAHGVDVIFHTAARVEVWGTWQEFYDTNVQGTRHVVDALLAAGVPRLVHFSSTSVYGRQTGVLDESAVRQRTGDSYSDSKLLAEEVLLEALRKHPFGLTILRPSLVYGPYDYKYIPRVSASIVKGRMPVVGRGTNPAPVVYGEDVADLAILAAERAEASGQIFNVSSSEAVNWKQFFSTLASCLGTRLPRRHVPPSMAYVGAIVLETAWKAAGKTGPPPATRFGVRLLSAHCQYDCTNASEILGYRARTFHKEGLRKTLEWMRREKVAGWQ